VLLNADMMEMELWAWGANNYGQLGIGHINEQCEEPIQVKSIQWKKSYYF